MSKTQIDADAVVDTAIRIADAEGLDNVTLTGIARDLGITQPGLYRHVDGYDDLLRTLSLRGRIVIADALSEAAVGQAGDDAVRAMAHAWRRTAREHPGVYAATDRYPCAGDDELEEAVELIVSTMARALDGYGISDAEGVHVARGLRSAFHGFVHLELGDGHPLPHDLDDTFDHLIDLLCAGIGRLADGAEADG